MSEKFVWSPEVASAPPPLLSVQDLCAGSSVLMHPRQPGSEYCYEHMPKAELDCRIQDHLQFNKHFIILQKRFDAAQAVAKRVSTGVSSGGVATLNQERRNGAKVRYPVGSGEFSEPVPTIYTPKSCYPYPNHRRRLKLAGSYATAECQVLDVGWIPGQKPGK